MANSGDTLSQGNTNENVTSTAPAQTHDAQQAVLQAQMLAAEAAQRAQIEAANAAARNRGLNSATVPTSKATGKAPKPSRAKKGK